jgi:hypothetical protein
MPCSSGICVVCLLRRNGRWCLWKTGSWRSQGMGPYLGIPPLVTIPEPPISSGINRRGASALFQDLRDVGAGVADVDGVTRLRTTPLPNPTPLPSTGRSSGSWCIGELLPPPPTAIHAPQATLSDLDHSAPREVRSSSITPTARQALSD